MGERRQALADFGDAGANTLGHIAQACALGRAQDGRSGPLRLPVLDGLGLLDQAAAKAWLADRPQLRAKARKTAQSLASEYRLAAGRALGLSQI